MSRRSRRAIATNLGGRLRHRIARRYQTVSQAIELPGLSLSFTRIADPDQVLEKVADEVDRQEKAEGKRPENEDLHLPYWAELWDSARAVAQWLIRNSPPGRPRRRVLDLGCGMGLCGSVAARIGDHVLFADLEPAALLFARLNSLPDAARVRTRRLNWLTDALDERFDLILGADIVYERRQWLGLESFWRRHVERSGLVLLGEPARQSGDGFIEWIADRDWSFQRCEEPVTIRPKPIRLLLLRPN